MYAKIGCAAITNPEFPIYRHNLIETVETACIRKYNNDWRIVLASDSKRGHGGNKLRTYRLFKKDPDTEPYCKLILPRIHRSALAKFRCGVAPIRLETGRYERLPVSSRVCPFCTDHVEDEMHVLLSCPLYNDIRAYLFDKANELNFKLC